MPRLFRYLERQECWDTCAPHRHPSAEAFGIAAKKTAPAGIHPAGAAGYRRLSPFVAVCGAPYFAVGIANSAPLPMLCGQRCITDFCFV
ncbi:hypothetical protein OJJOAM_003210 [Cupriavidus sp. H18C1]